MTNINKLILTVALMSACGMAFSESSSSEKSLQDRLTPVGAIRAGNEEGTIPRWDGGMATPPDAYTGGVRVDPFQNEAPLYVITKENLEEHKDKLTTGQLALFEKYPNSFKMPIYPTHRTATAPAWVFENAAKNIDQAELTDNGNGVKGAFGGIPFPHADSGIKTIWNHLLRWQGQGQQKNYLNLTIYDSGTVAVGGATIWEDYPFYAKDQSAATYNGNSLHLLAKYDLPVRRKGEVFALRESVRPEENPREAWQYIPGQRRVRRAPTIGFDTPNPSVNGLSTYDDGFMFSGSPERYDWQLVGTEEKLVPYNNNQVFEMTNQGQEKALEVFTPKHMNPDYSRWELHRVHVVEATLKEGQRHTYPRRRFYIDEDTWTILASEAYDSRGNLWRIGFANVLNAYDVPATVIRALWYVDLEADAYGVTEVDVEPLRFYEGEDDSFFTPNGVRQMSRR